MIVLRSKLFNEADRNPEENKVEKRIKKAEKIIGGLSTAATLEEVARHGYNTIKKTNKEGNEIANHYNDLISKVERNARKKVADINNPTDHFKKYIKRKNIAADTAEEFLEKCKYYQDKYNKKLQENYEKKVTNLDNEKISKLKELSGKAKEEYKNKIKSSKVMKAAGIGAAVGTGLMLSRVGYKKYKKYKENKNDSTKK